MLIEVLFVPGCPNHEPAFERLRTVLCSEAINASIQEIAVTDEVMARSLKFSGSPTVRIDGRDVESSLPQILWFSVQTLLGRDRSSIA